MRDEVIRDDTVINDDPKVDDRTVENARLALREAIAQLKAAIFEMISKRLQGTT